MRNKHWYSARNQSLAIYARDADFDLAMYHDYSENVQNELRQRAVKEALYSIRSSCEDDGCNISNITKGNYVISLAHPLSIRYRYGRSQVIYIGSGNIMVQIRDHFDYKLFDFMLSLAGADFDFYFARPALQRTSTYYKHVEHLMLEYFSEQYGGMDDKRRFPILNKNAVNNKNFLGGTNWWKKPLKASGKRPFWELKPTNFSDFPPLDINESEK